jgi:hypothetical protein
MPVSAQRCRRSFSAFVQRRQFLNLARRGDKRIEDAYVADVPAMLEIFRNDLADAKALGIGPQVRVEPGQSVGRAAT